MSRFTLWPPGESLFHERREATTPAGTLAFPLADTRAVKRMLPRALKTSTISPSRMPRGAASSLMHLEGRVVPVLHLLMHGQIGECGIHVVVGFAREKFQRIGTLARFSFFRAAIRSAARSLEGDRALALRGLRSRTRLAAGVANPPSAKGRNFRREPPHSNLSRIWPPASLRARAVIPFSIRVAPSLHGAPGRSGRRACRGSSLR